LSARYQWLTSLILATQESEIRWWQFEASPGKQLSRPYLKKTHHKKRAGGVAQGRGPEFNPQYQKNKKKIDCNCSSMAEGLLSKPGPGLDPQHHKQTTKKKIYHYFFYAM
jgi:hypothetical protein